MVMSTTYHPPGWCSVRRNRPSVFNFQEAHELQVCGVRNRCVEQRRKRWKWKNRQRRRGRGKTVETFGDGLKIALKWKWEQRSERSKVRVGMKWIYIYILSEILEDIVVISLWYIYIHIINFVLYRFIFMTSIIVSSFDVVIWSRYFLSKNLPEMDLDPGSGSQFWRDVFSLNGNSVSETWEETKTQKYSVHSHRIHVWYMYLHLP